MNQEDMIRDIHERFRQSGQELNELQRRIWAAKEAIRIGSGGVTLVSKALRISPNTIKRGIQEIEAGQADLNSSSMPRIRKPGGGRKSKKDETNHPIPAAANRDATAAQNED